MFKKYCIILLLILATANSPSAQINIDSDKNGIPDGYDLCPGIIGTTSNKGYPEEGSEFTEAGKKLLIKNFQTVLLHIPTKFAKIKKGEADIDVSEHISWYKSTLLLFPNYSDKDVNRIMFVTYSGKPVVAFTETNKLDVKHL